MSLIPEVHKLMPPTVLIVDYEIGEGAGGRHFPVMVGSCWHHLAPAKVEALVLKEDGTMVGISKYMEGLCATSFKVIGVRPIKGNER